MHLQICVGELFIHLLDAQTQKFWRCPNFPTYSKYVLTRPRRSLVQIIRSDRNFSCRRKTRLWASDILCSKVKWKFLLHGGDYSGHHHSTTFMFSSMLCNIFAATELARHHRKNFGARTRFKIKRNVKQRAFDPPFKYQILTYIPFHPVCWHRIRKEDCSLSLMVHFILFL